MMGKLGEILYGSAKEWEWQLLRESDLSLLMQKEARELLKIENPQVKVSEISIIGLDTEYSIGLDDIDFKKRWARKAVSYIGSYGAWHSLHYIVDSLVYFNKAINDSEALFVTTQPIKGKINKKIKVTSIRHSEIMYFYKDLLALIIPGKKCTNYFDSIQLSANLFSTKAVEALSSGVPLIVNSDIRGLANFVLENKCGILFRMEEHGIKLLNCNVDDLNSYEFWAQMTRNSLEIGSQFRLQKVADKYLQYYKSII
jgi:glycosyltransferase involved in cell wall biosynthesis